MPRTLGDFDYEGELAPIIGKPGRRIEPRLSATRASMMAR
jgi:2-keto-4-pentenoate hydratase/2-oxohepta-3-ene-1,7-dioic acid hydratase in catechol pathway